MRSLGLRLFGWPVAALICLALSTAAGQAGPLQDCAAMLPWGAPAMNDAAPHTYLCRLAYVVRHNDVRHEPDWVAWPTSRANAAGCLPRSDSFAPIRICRPAPAPPGHYDEPISTRAMSRATPASFAAEPERQSFLMSNMTPQTGANNHGPYRARRAPAANGRRQRPAASGTSPGRSLARGRAVGRTGSPCRRRAG